jgi:GTP cyclohydrolase II
MPGERGTNRIQADPDPEPASNGAGHGGEPLPEVGVAAIAALPTEFGTFRIIAFAGDRDGKEHVAIVHGEVDGGEAVPLRVHSECLTGDVLGSLRCDCRAQLHAALEAIAAEPRGVVLYLRQEGRGIGLVNKIRAYALQDQGLDTVDANLALGFRDDEREYSVAAQMIRSLGIASIRLVTNNPDKVAQLVACGIDVVGRIAHVMPPTEHNRFYLHTKATRSGHLIEQAEPAVPDADDEGNEFR